ncbi:MAG: yvcI [Chlamydiales bacterium]|jgi:8-oxo-dGTP pyrophosphatase MutT (NUDIX family)|nr:yvcI [Chlamydiales bacterium]
MNHLYDVAPKDFNTSVAVAAIYVACQGKLLWLKRSSLESSPGCWCVPGGRIKQGESPEEGACRELFEETGIEENPLLFLGTFYLRRIDLDYVYHLFELPLAKLPTVILSEESSAFRWVAPHEIIYLKTLSGAQEGLEKYLSLKRRMCDSA